MILHQNLVECGFRDVFLSYTAIPKTYLRHSGHIHGERKLSIHVNQLYAYLAILILILIHLSTTVIPRTDERITMDDRSLLLSTICQILIRIMKLGPTFTRYVIFRTIMHKEKHIWEVEPTQHTRTSPWRTIYICEASVVNILQAGDHVITILITGTLFGRLQLTATRLFVRQLVQGNTKRT